MTKVEIDEILTPNKRLSVATGMKVVWVEEALAKKRGKAVGSVDELVKHLKADGLI